ncbi:MAG: hypothetical protein EZS28_013492 [Streblomastix strix]|uniref:Uncharacterized protein n=1 Tax=Streblomastix strix TaxID=222440 RepID=A0A5J4W7X9_9EUKA|nr:MAG: hypothetical protein EZS28_013492 [Streblomastix strix]
MALRYFLNAQNQQSLSSFNTATVNLADYQDLARIWLGICSRQETDDANTNIGFTLLEVDHDYNDNIYEIIPKERSTEIIAICKVQLEFSQELILQRYTGIYLLMNNIVTMYCFKIGKDSLIIAPLEDVNLRLLVKFY